MAGPWEKYGGGGGQPSLQRVGPENQKRPLEVQGAQLSNTRAAQQIDADRQLIPLQVQKARADATAAAAAAQKSSLDTGLDPQKLANIRAAQSQITRLAELYKKGPGRTKGLSGVLDFLPTPGNSQFNTAGAGLGEVGLAAFRVPGVGSQTDADLKAFVDANRPSSSDYDTTINEKIRNLQNRLNQTYQAYKIKPQSGGGGSKVIDFNDLPE